jgi:hypothetical protein
MAFESGRIPQETLDFLAAKKADDQKKARGPLVLLFVILIVLGIWIAVASNSDDSASKPKQASATQDAPSLPYQPDESIVHAKAYMATKQYRLALDELEGLRPIDAKRPGVQSMVTKATHEVQLADLNEKRQARLNYAKEYERSLLAAGMDAEVRATGQNADTLSTTFVLINRPFVYNIQNDHNLNSTWTSLGFKSVHLDDGFDSSWSYKLQ